MIMTDILNVEEEEEYSTKFTKRIVEMFPDVDLQFLSHECGGLTTEEDFARFINTVMLNGIYPRKNPDRSDEEASSSGTVELGDCLENKEEIGISDSPEARLYVEGVTGSDSTNAEMGEEEDRSDWLEEQTAELIRLFPETDPTYLRAECAKFQGSVEKMNLFVLSNLEKNDMPSRADYEKRQEMEQLKDLYTKNFSVEDFLQVIPDPCTYFSNSNRNCAKYKLHSLVFLENRFRGINPRDITNIMMKNNFNLYLSCKELQEKDQREKCEFECNLQAMTKISINFLQEVAFIQNEGKIRDFIEVREAARLMRLEEAKKSGGTVLECRCCYDPEVMIEDIVYCPKDHPFCKACVVKYVEMEMAEARFEFPCLAGCGDTFTMFTLQGVIKPEVMFKVVQGKQMGEIQAAGIENLVQCPFCSYAAILPPEDKVMTCLNPECRKKTCRLCKELCHIPLRCDEIEKSEDVKRRTYIENKMTEALIRTCYNCGKGFVKEDGCNKIVCKCGAKMCYVCRKPVADYSHFKDHKGTDKCPLYSTNDELHVELVNKAGEEAKAEVFGHPGKMAEQDETRMVRERSRSRSYPKRRRTGAIPSAVPNRFL